MRGRLLQASKSAINAYKSLSVVEKKKYLHYAKLINELRIAKKYEQVPSVLFDLHTIRNQTLSSQHLTTLLRDLSQNNQNTLALQCFYEHH